MRSVAARSVVLVGGGHSHVQVLRRWAMAPPKDLRLMVVLDRPIAVYSGMVPGFVAGDYTHTELEIDVVPLARRANAGVILSRAVDLDPVRGEIAVEGRPPLHYDLASIDVGSTVRGLDLPGVLEHALATRPIVDFVRKVDLRIEALSALGRAGRILVAGGGTAGSELAFTLDARLRGRGLEPRISIVTAESELLAEAGPGTRALIAREAQRRGVETIPHRRVIRVDAGGAFLESVHGPEPDTGDEYFEADLVIWATGADPAPFPARQTAACLPRDKQGFIEVRDSLQTVGFDDVFAAGDCARLVNHPWVPRAGVYAVRQGPVLERNLRARLEGRPLQSYRPQRNFLSILHLGDGRALATKWGRAVAGPGTLRLKDWIDRRFMKRFQVLDEFGAERPALVGLGGMNSNDDDEAEMACGGCAAKLGALPLEAALAALAPPPEDSSVVLGLEARDDVAATRDEAGRMTLHNVDVIRAFCDDPFLIGRIAASNALSDLYAKGGRPRYAQAIIGLPDHPPALARDILYQALAGIRSTLDRLDVTLLGGHTTIGDFLTVGLSVSGDGPREEQLLRQAGSRPGDDLLLTQPLGTGAVLAADMQGLARGDWIQSAHAVMLHPNRTASRLAREHKAHAATDVTGFGLAGHLLNLLDESGLIARIERQAVTLLPGARGLWDRGLRSTAHPANHAAFAPRVMGASEADEGWLFDPQTSGGLLLAIAPERTQAISRAFREAGEPELVRIGCLVAGKPESLPPRGGIEVIDATGDRTEP